MTQATKPVIAFLGAGNMATSLISGLCEDDYPVQSIIATRRDNDRLHNLAEEFGIQTTTDNQNAIKSADIVVLCVKPIAMQDLCTDIKTTLQQHKPVVMSVAAGIKERTLNTWLDGDLAIIRCMPNTPAFIRCGVSGLYANPQTTSAQRDMAEHIARAVGMVYWVDQEEQLHAITALSGSGPAYFYAFMEGLMKAAVKAGLSPNMAEAMTLQTALGAAKMALTSDLSITQLRENVTSPNGTTEKALNVFSDQQLPIIIDEALSAALYRSRELANTFD